VLVMVILTNPIGRFAGPLWVIAGLIFYYLYRHARGLPILSSVPRDWAQEQIKVYRESGETALAEEYQNALRRRARLTMKDGRTTSPRGPGR
jgi:hypothetical protein